MSYMKHTSIATAADAVKYISSGQRVFIQGSAATPIRLVQALIERKNELRDVELVSISLHGIKLRSEDLRGHFFVNSLFVSESVRQSVNDDTGDYVPVFLSEIPGLFVNGELPLDVALIHVSPPDKHGYCSLGTSVDVAKTAVKYAKTVIAQVNPNMPRVHGDAFIPFHCIDYAVEVNDALPEVSYSEAADAVSEKIGHHVASLVEDGATLQLGIGTIPDQVFKM